jgi:hypothetical protein
MNSLQQVVHDQTENLVIDGAAVLRGAPDAPVQLLAPHRFVTGLATAPATLPRMFLGIGAQLVVPPGTWAVVHLPGGAQRTYGPGSYWLWGEPGAILVQWVDARRQQIPVGPVEGWSADKWRVRLWMVIDVAVSEPQVIAAHREPINALVAAARAALLHYIEQHSHAALTGLDAGAGGMAAPAQAVLTHLRADPALDGLEIISARLVERQGDERQIEAATAATVAAAQIDEERRVESARHRARLHELEAQVTINEREHQLRMASAAAQARERLLMQQAEVQQATLAARLEIVMAQIRAQTAEIAHDEQVWQAEQQRIQQEWELIQQRQLQAHQTDQQVRLLDAQQGLVRTEGELALAAADRHQAHLLQLAEMQERLAEHRTTQARLVAERREQHERTLLELHLRHDELVAEQMQKLEQWRIERTEVRIQQQRQHDRQLAGIVGAAQIAAAAAAQVHPENETQAIADAGLRMLQDLAE